MISVFPSRAYIICCDARTGSSLLAGVLRMTKIAGKPFEYFAPEEIDKPSMRSSELHVPDGEKFTDFRSWRDYIVRAGSEYNDVFGLSLHWFQLRYALAAFAAEPGDDTRAGARPIEIFRAFFPRIRFVWLHRRNLVAQAISHYVAISTGAWGERADRPRPDRKVELEAPYNYSEIDRLVAHAQTTEAGWRAALAEAPRLTLELTYEDMNADLDAAVRSVLSHLDLSLGTAPVPRPVLRKQSTEWSRELERLYRNERRALAASPVGDEHRI